ncbi:uncharacterized protein [Rutidosis leptorrhynchoides]|uniref:uncharacterized protein n=1 Tax=Rutidosis leptorrhynchoides TaxID=125765 RepID=UPI003A993D6E
MDNSTFRSLDDVFQEYAESSLPKHPQTGILYNASLPSNFTGIQVSIVRLRRDSYFGRGANYSGFNMPPKIQTLPYFTRLDIIYSNLGNRSSDYYNVPNHTFVAPVVGFNVYGSKNSTGQIGNLTTLATKVNLTLSRDPVLVNFSNISLQQNVNAKCAMFYSNGTFDMTNMIQQDVCVVRDQGHFSIVVPTKPSIRLGRKEESGNKLWKWWVFGFGVGVLGLLLIGFFVILTLRIIRMRKIGRMEKEAEKNEALVTTNVGQSKMPFATVVRTQPVIENDYVP